MAKKGYIGVGGRARKIKKLYVGINGIAREVKKAYVGINGVTELFFQKGASWKEVSLPYEINWSAITYGASKFVAVANASDKIAYSTNGIYWSYVTLPDIISLNDICYGNWNLVTPPETPYFTDITYGGGKYAALSSTNHRISYSEDLINWETIGTPTTGMNNIAYGDGKFISFYGTQVYYSKDLASWASTNSGLDVNTSFTPGTLFCENNFFVSLAKNANKCAYSTDGIIWEPGILPSSADWRCIAYGDGKYMAIADSGEEFAYSADGRNWTTSTLPYSAKWSGIAYGDGKFVVIQRYSNKAFYSTD